LGIASGFFYLIIRLQYHWEFPWVITSLRYHFPLGFPNSLGAIFLGNSHSLNLLGKSQWFWYLILRWQYHWEFPWVITSLRYHFPLGFPNSLGPILLGNSHSLILIGKSQWFWYLILRWQYHWEFPWVIISLRFHFPLGFPNSLGAILLGNSHCLNLLGKSQWFWYLILRFHYHWEFPWLPYLP